MAPRVYPRVALFSSIAFRVCFFFISVNSALIRADETMFGQLHNCDEEFVSINCQFLTIMDSLLTEGSVVNGSTAMTAFASRIRPKEMTGTTPKWAARAYSHEGAVVRKVAKDGK